MEIMKYLILIIILGLAGCGKESFKSNKEWNYLFFSSGVECMEINRNSGKCLMIAQNIILDAK